MTIEINRTHDADQTSWVHSANNPDCDFPIQNLPFGVFRVPGDGDVTRVGIAIGDQIFDVVRAWELGLFSAHGAKGAEACRSGRLNELMGLDRMHWTALRQQAWEALSTGFEREDLAALALFPMEIAEMTLPTDVRNFSDFSFSIAHNQTLGEVSKRERPLHPSFGYLPTGYHGRASSIRLSGAPCKRPRGQLGERTATKPTFGPCQRLDYEMELSIFIGPGNELGKPISLENAEDHIFGLGLLNDWTARDVQSWEITPLGPFQGKSHLTSISPWVVTLEALAPFRAEPTSLIGDDRELFDYLVSAEDRRNGAINITAETMYSSQSMRDRNIDPVCTSRASAGAQYWTIFQLLAHQTINGCNVLPGDILGSGTISSEGENGRGCLQEKTYGGTRPFALPSGEQRTFLEDGDRVTITAHCQSAGYRRIGFGSCTGQVAPSDG